MTDKQIDWKVEIINRVDQYILTLHPEDTTGHVQAEKFKQCVLELPE